MSGALGRTHLKSHGPKGNLDAEQDGGIVVSAATVPEVWMAVTRKQGSRAVALREYELYFDV